MGVAERTRLSESMRCVLDELADKDSTPGESALRVADLRNILTLRPKCCDYGSDALFGCRWNVRVAWRELNGSRE